MKKRNYTDPILKEFDELLWDSWTILEYQRDIALINKKLKQPQKYSKQYEDLSLFKNFIQSEIDWIDFRVNSEFFAAVERLEKYWIIKDLKIEEIKIESNHKKIELILSPSQKIKNNYWYILKKNWIDYYEKQYQKRVKDKKLREMVNYEKDMFKSVYLTYCELIDLNPKTKEQEKTIQKVYLIYKEFIEDCLRLK